MTFRVKDAYCPQLNEATKEPKVLITSTAFLVGVAAGGAVIFLFPGLGAGGNAIWKNVVKPFFSRTFK